MSLQYIDLNLLLHSTANQRKKELNSSRKKRKTLFVNESLRMMSTILIGNELYRSRVKINDLADFIIAKFV